MLRDAVAADAATEKSRRELAKVYVETGRPRDAIALLRSAPIAEAESLELLGVALASGGENDEARSALLRAWQASPGNGRVALNIGILALHRSDGAEARQWLERAVQASPGNAAAWTDLGLAQAAGGDETAAAASWNRALALNPEQWDAVFNLAVFEMKNGAADAGRRRMQRFLSVAPKQRFSRELAEARRLLGPGGKA